jgi:glycosyltransferase involved in cell wall biosynthesis
MHIVIMTGPFLPPPPGPAGAVERIWLGLAGEFVRAGHRVTFLCRTAAGQCPDETVNGVRFVRRMRLARHQRMAVCLARDFQYTWRMAGLVPRDADVVVTNTFWAPALVPLRRRGRMLVAPNIARMPKGQLALYRRAGRLLVVSQAVRAAVVAESPALAGRVRVVPNPIDTTAFRPAPEVAHAESLRLLYAGRLHPEKGIQVLIEAARRLAASGRWFDLEVVGPWTVAEGGGGTAFRQRLQEQAGPLPVVWREPVYDRQALAKVYQTADVFCYPSLAEQGETFGVAPLEAMACGVPAVVSDLPCFRDYLTPDANGIAFDHRGPDPAASLAAALARLIDSPALRREMGRKAAETAVEYSYEAVAAHYLREFHSWMRP